MLPSHRHHFLPLVFLALLALSCIPSSESAGTCSSSHPQAPKSLLATESTAASVTGTRLRVHPRIPQTGRTVEEYYIDSEVLLLRELATTGECFSSVDSNSLNYDYLQQVNTSECNCAHSRGTDHFPGTSIRRDYIRIRFDCPTFTNLSLTLDVNTVNGSYAVAHPAAQGPNATTYDYYTYVLRGSTRIRVMSRPSRRPSRILSAFRAYMPSFFDFGY